VYEACGPTCPPPAMTTILSLDGNARPLRVWRAASAPRGLCCMVRNQNRQRGEDTKTGKRLQGHGGRAGPRTLCLLCSETCTLTSGGVCVEPAACPCEWHNSFFPPGTVLQKDCGNW
jgi:hypothetical protein